MDLMLSSLVVGLRPNGHAPGRLLAAGGSCQTRSNALVETPDTLVDLFLGPDRIVAGKV
jgi:hypothetical protein